MLKQLDDAVHQFASESRTLALLLLDLDGFKEINDTLGHEAGDALLCQIGPRVSGLLRAEDTLARLGGDEFALLLPDRSEDEAVDVACEISEVIRAPFTVASSAVEVNVSIGIAMFPQQSSRTHTLLRLADVAMYVAKHHGTGVAVYDASLDEHNPERLALVHDLRRALDLGALDLYFQPKVDLSTGAVLGAEALVRWPHPERGLILPDVFVPMAVQAGLTARLTDCVFDAAVRQRQVWRAQGLDVDVAVNFSTRDLQDRELMARLQRALAARAASPVGLTIEITEDSLIHDTGQVLENVRLLRAAGFRVSIDDFGTGYSSLARLIRLPVDELKIDRSFVRQIDNPREAAVVRSIIDLGRHLGLRVVAEGIETPKAAALLRSLGCREGQGYLYGRPVPAALFAEANSKQRAA